jgi:hypothetical protein
MSKVEGFQRRRLKCQKLMDDGRQPSDGKSSHCLWQGELKNSFLCFSKQVKTKTVKDF